jgi:2,3,4,5-tetrahydropyridine-2-carboxylate N-succinyltransferase
MNIQRVGHRYRDVETGKTIDVWFPASNSRMNRHCLAEKAGLILGDFVDVTIESLDEAPRSTEEAWLRLHLLSKRTVKPNEINLDGIFGLLTNVE